MICRFYNSVQFCYIVSHGAMSLLNYMERLNAFCAPGNVLKELSEPSGAVIYTSKFTVSCSLQELINKNTVYVEVIY